MDTIKRKSENEKVDALFIRSAWRVRGEERQRLGTAKCKRCFFFDGQPKGNGYCHHSVNTEEPEKRPEWWCEHFLPRATDDPDPAESK